MVIIANRVLITHGIKGKVTLVVIAVRVLTSPHITSPDLHALDSRIG